MTDRPLSHVLVRLEELGCLPRGRNGSWAAPCPAHEDRRPSLSLREGDGGQVLIKCHAGCRTENVLERLGLSWADLFPPQERRNDHQPEKRQAQQPADPLSWWAERCGVPRGWLEKLPLEARDDAVAFTWPGLEAAKLRAPEGKGYWAGDGPRPPLWPTLPDEAPPVLVLTEGESDATVALYVLEAAGLQGAASAHAVTKGAAAKPDVMVLREALARGARALLVVADADEAGERAARHWANAAREVGLATAILDLVGRGLVSPSLGEKDLRDAYRRQPARVMAEMKAAVEGLAEGASSVPTNGVAVGTQLLTPADIVAAAEEELESLPLLGQVGVVIKGWSHLLAAPPKCGKTELVWACVREWDALGLRVLWVSEEGESVWAQRLRRGEAAPERVRWLMAAGMRPEDILAALREAAPDFDVVIVDTLRHLFRVDEGDNALIARTISGLDDAIGRGRTRIYLHHTRKAPGQHGERTAGGLAFVGGVDRQLELAWDDHDDTRRVLKGVSRIAPVPTLLLAWEDGRLRALGEAAAVELGQVKERVLGVLTEEWQTTPQILAALGEPRPSDEQVRRALRELAQLGLVERDPPITEGERRGRPHRWRLAPPQFSSNGTHISWNRTPPQAKRALPAWVLEELREELVCVLCGQEAEAYTPGGEPVCQACLEAGQDAPPEAEFTDRVSGQGPGGVYGHKVSGQSLRTKFTDTGSTDGVSGQRVSGQPPGFRTEFTDTEFTDAEFTDSLSENVSGQGPCRGCGQALPRRPTGRPPRWCSDSCRKRAARREKG